MKLIKYVVLCLVAGLVIFYYDKNVFPLFMDKENRKLGDILAAYVPLVFVLTWVVYGGYRFFIDDKQQGSNSE